MIQICLSQNLLFNGIVGNFPGQVSPYIGTHRYYPRSNLIIKQITVWASINTSSDLVIGELSDNFINPLIINTTPSGWTLHDPAAGVASNSVTPVVFRSAWSDDPTNFKNVYLQAITPTNLALTGYHTWDKETHTGTFPTVVSVVNNNWNTIPMVSGMQYIISVSPNHILIHTCVVATGYGNTQSGVFEFTRDDPWRTVAKGYPAWLHLGATYGVNTDKSNIAIPFAFSMSSGVDVSPALATVASTNSPVPGAVFVPDGLIPDISLTWNNGSGCFLSGQCQAFSQLDFSQGANENKAAAKYVFDICLRPANASTSYTQSIVLGGNISEISPFVFITHNAIGNPGDDFILGNDTYMVAGNSLASHKGRLLIKKA